MLAKNYVGSTSFIIDIVATVPVAEIVDLIAAGNNNQFVKWLKLLKIFRIVRLAKL